LEKLLPTVKVDFLVFEPNAAQELENFMELNDNSKSQLQKIRELLIR